ncbi:MAG: hypothetical protein M1829_001686 [Trizodia sp. TS-e1964]|nr:MAG: hypothetical protein M1829_001686 [Trizodia sp. TS-e1964]
MSLEAALDEERLEILKLLEGSPGPYGSGGLGARAGSPVGARSPVRSMLDIAGNPPKPTAKSRIAFGQTPVRSLLDPSPSSLGHFRTANKSPTQAQHNLSNYRVNNIAPTDYQFDPLPNIQGNSLPKRVTQGGRKSSSIPNTMASVVHTPDITGSISLDRKIPAAGIVGSHHGNSKTPSMRLGRSQSPHNMLNTNSFNPQPDPGTFVDKGGKVIDFSIAYRRLSNSALARSGGSLSNLPARPASENIRAGGLVSPIGDSRLEKDYFMDNDEAAIDSSDEQSDSSETSDLEGRRGRERSRADKLSANSTFGGDSANPVILGVTTPMGMGRAKGPRKTLSLLAAAEQERREVSSLYKVKSMLGPAVEVTTPGGERLANKKKEVHPATSFSQSNSSFATPLNSETEADLSDIRRAQRMQVNISPIKSFPETSRSLQTIIRGEFFRMQQEAEAKKGRSRSYLVATDLSDEAAHALEWTIGTVLRDGDTLMAYYAVDEEIGTGKDNDNLQSMGIGEGGVAAKDNVEITGPLTTQAARTLKNSVRGVSPLSVAHLTSRSSSVAKSPDGRKLSKSEQERYHASNEIAQLCVRLLRKTRLQVRVIIEIVHCKSPKHLITEAIDHLEPTLVILGSRGRSALKGVLLGSFSNYLVTKSSVPVMVARKKLRKHSKHKKINPRLSNNLTVGIHNSLATAKID